jgi:hypothetical protein
VPTGVFVWPAESALNELLATTGFPRLKFKFKEVLV